MALNTSKCNHLTPLPFKGLKCYLFSQFQRVCHQGRFYCNGISLTVGLVTRTAAAAADAAASNNIDYDDNYCKCVMPVMTLQEQKMSEMIHVKVRLAQGSDTYVIRDVSANDQGRYFCRATNAFGVKEASVDVRMLGER